tara:strand:- start:121 stop:291 length:171 start_codon:yes stop_codon:yes gene_type:complete
MTRIREGFMIQFAELKLVGIHPIRGIGDEVPPNHIKPILVDLIGLTSDLEVKRYLI